MNHIEISALVRHGLRTRLPRERRARVQDRRAGGFCVRESEDDPVAARSLGEGQLLAAAGR